MNDKNQHIARVGRIAAVCAIVGAVCGTTAAYGQNGTLGASDVGRSTNEWLALQRDNRAAAPVQPVLGDVATLAYQRYLDSFKSKIPSSMSSQIGAGGGQAAQ